jgi:5-methylcytosine-specific restriction endonuclease McrA
VGEKNPMFGKTHSLASRQKMSERKLGIKGKYHHSEETKENIRLSNIGKNKGRKHTLEARKKISEATQKENHPNWKGGITEDWNQYAAIQAHKRRALKNGNGGSFTIAEWEKLKEKFNFTCPMCTKKEPEIKLSVDHIIPVSKGGPSDISNIQPLCTICNIKKGTKIFQIIPEPASAA